MITDLSKVNNPEELAAGAGEVLPVPERTLEVVAAEIRGYTFSMLTNIIEIGRRLVEAKSMIKHGEFMNWTRENFGFSSSQTNNFMQLYRAYGSEQNSLFGAELNSQTFGNLNYSKALALLALPSTEEREEFMETHDVENMTTRQLKDAIRERDEAMKAAKDAEGRLAAERIESEKKDQAIESFIQDRKDLDRQRTEAEARLKEAEEQFEASEKLRAEIADKLFAKNADIEAANKRIRELESRPVEVAVETVRDEEAIAAAAKEAREKAEAAAKKRIAELEKKLNKAEDERAEAVRKAESADQTAAKKLKEATAAAEKIRVELEETRRALKASDSDVTAFGIRFNSLQTEYSYLITEYRKIRSKNRETGDKLHEAVRQVLEYFQQELEKEEGAAGA